MGLGFSPLFFIEGLNTLLSFSIVQSFVLFWALVQYCDFLDLNSMKGVRSCNHTLIGALQQCEE